MAKVRITFSEAARQLGLTNSAVLKMKGRVKCVKPTFVDTSCPSWEEILENRMLGLAVDGGLPRANGRTGKRRGFDYLEGEKAPASKPGGSMGTASLAIQENKAIKLRAEAEKAELDVRKRKDELVEKAELGEVCFSYLDGANLALLSMPEAIVDNIIASVQAKGVSARPDLITLITKEISRVLDKTITEQEFLFKKKNSTPG